VYYIGERGRVQTFNALNLKSSRDLSAAQRSTQIKVTRFPNGYALSTVLLSIDHGNEANGKPVIFETMLFDANGGVSNLLSMRRYHHRFQAKSGHRTAVSQLSHYFKSSGQRVHIKRRP
ncbi:MAG: hypothetical protein ACRC4U_01655, partial [Shewanella sp.]